MKALSLWQPWATLMAMGDKTIETRSEWAMRLASLVGQDLAIHAAKRTELGSIGQYHARQYRGRAPHLRWFSPALHDDIEVTLPLGAVVAVVRVLAVVPMVGPGSVVGPSVYVPGPSSNGTPDGRGTVGTLWGWHLRHAAEGLTGWTDLTAELPFGHYEPGRVAVVTDNLRRLTKPVSCRGYQQAFTLPAEVEAQVLAQVHATATTPADLGRLL